MLFYYLILLCMYLFRVTDVNVQSVVNITPVLRSHLKETCCNCNSKEHYTFELKSILSIQDAQHLSLQFPLHSSSLRQILQAVSAFIGLETALQKKQISNSTRLFISALRAAPYQDLCMQLICAVCSSERLTES